MKFSLATIAYASAFLSASVSLAAPSPKVAELRGAKRPARKTLVPSSFVPAPVSFHKTADTSSPSVSAPKKNIWASLTFDEATDVVTFLRSQEHLNLTAAADAGAWDNKINIIDLMNPPKEEALAYMAGEGEAPARVAKVIINFKATEEPYDEEFLVELPITESTVAVPADKYTTKGSAKIRNYDADDSGAFVLAQAETISDIIEDLLGAPYDSFSYWGIDPLWYQDGQVIQWSQAWGEPATIFDGQTLLPQGLYCQTIITGRDASKWRLAGWLYNGEFYSTSAEFRAAWETPDFVRAERNIEGFTGTKDPFYGTDKPSSADLPYDTKAPPMMIQPEGERFAVDSEQRYVQWMDFSFYYSFTRDSGLRLFNIKYKGERIIYELGLQEATAHYASNDPTQSGTGYLDTYYGFGPYAYELLPGFDCPTYANMQNLTYHQNEVTVTHPNSLCLFETDTGIPIARHTNQEYISVTKDIAFKLRTVSTIGNYADYTFDYTFHIDGSIETAVHASGYIQSAFYAANSDYGYTIGKGLSGSMHDHVLTFKADLDILGTANTFERTNIVPSTEKYVWSNITRNTMKLERHLIKSEDESKLDWGANGASMFTIANQDKLNEFGERRAWRIHPSIGGGMHLTVKESTNLQKSNDFTTHGLYVTKQSDYEQASQHSKNANSPSEPIIKFGDYFNGESLEQEDLVVWYNLGMHHVPVQGDLPNTVQTMAAAAMMISPHNYMPRDASVETSQRIRLNFNTSLPIGERVTENKRFGAYSPVGSFQLPTVNYDSYSGANRTRKFPLNLAKANATEARF